MTLAVQYPQSTSTASGAPGASFPVGFSFTADNELLVTFQTGTDTPRVQTAGVDYLVTGSRITGGAMLVPLTGHEPLAGDMVTISRETPFEQPDSYGDATTFTPLAVERSLDRITRLLQELKRDVALGGGGGGGGGGGVVLWGSIPDKPSTFTPSPHTHPITDVINLTSSLAGKASNDLTTVSNAAFLAKATAAGVGSAATVDWTTQVTGKPATFTPSAHTHPQSDVTGLATALGLKADKDLLNVTNADFAAKATAAGVGTGTGSLPPSLSSFGAIDGGGVATTDNDAALTAAEASTEPRIYLPKGKHATTKHPADLQKGYIGPGRFLFTTDSAMVAPGDFSQQTSAPFLPATQGNTGFFDTTNGFSRGEWKIIGPDIRETVDARYFESAYIPHPVFFDVYSGHSGLTAKLTVGASAGQPNIVVNAAYPELVGKTIALLNSGTSAGVEVERRVVQSVAGNVITFTTNLANTYPSGTAITTGLRTWAGHTYVKVRHKGGGDAYGHLVRMSVDYQPKPGQDHCFYRATGGLYGGETVWTSGAVGCYATGWESQAHDLGISATAYIAQVDSFSRDNDDIGYGNVWMGTYFKSDGAKPADVAHAVAGKWRVGLDTVRADLSTFASVGDGKNIAVNMALGQGICLNSGFDTSKAVRGGGGEWGVFYGNVAGDMFLKAGNDGVDFIDLAFLRSAPNNARVRIRPQSVNTNVNFLSAGSVLGNGDLSLSNTGVIAFGLGSGYYLQLVANRLYMAIGGTLYQVALHGLTI